MISGAKYRIIVLQIIFCAGNEVRAANVFFTAAITCAGIFKQSMGARGNRLRIGLSYRPARLHSLAKLGPRNLFMGS